MRPPVRPRKRSVSSLAVRSVERPTSPPTVHNPTTPGGTVTTMRRLVLSGLSVSLALAPPFVSAAGAQAPSAGTVPAIAGLTVVTAIQEARGDYEAIEH